MSNNIESQPINEEETHSQSTINHYSKYNSDVDRHEAIKGQKRQWYRNNCDKQKLKSLKYYYQKQLKKIDLNEATKSKYESKLNELNQKLNLI